MIRATKALQTRNSDKQAETLSSPDKVFAAICRGILSGRLVPGQKLIEADIASELNVSRGPIREAFKRLSAEGVVVATRHRGVYVRSLSRQDAMDFLEILEALTILIAALAGRAMAKADDAFLEQHAHNIGWLQRHAEAVNEDGQLDRSGPLYNALIAIGGNTQINTIMPVTRIQLFRMQTNLHLTGQANQQRIAEYSEIAKAVLRGNSQAAQRAMRAHMRATGKRIAELPDEAFSR